MPLVAAIDNDDVIVPLVPAINQFYNSRYGTHFKIADYTSFHFEDVWGVSHSVAEARMVQFFHTPWFINLAPREDAVIGINLLAKMGVEQHQVSARPDLIHRHTHWFFEIYFHNLFEQLHFSSNIGTSLSSDKRSKVDILQDIEADIYFEDNLEYVVMASEVVGIVFMLDQPWNQTNTILPRNIYRVTTWYEAIHKLRSLIY